jgi:hypothetical protein
MCFAEKRCEITLFSRIRQIFEQELTFLVVFPCILSSPLVILATNVIKGQTKGDYCLLVERPKPEQEQYRSRFFTS